MVQRIDWASCANPELYDQGAYEVRVNSWEYTTASTGMEQVRWKATIRSDINEGKPVQDHSALSEKALWRLANFVQACNIKLDNIPEMTVKSNEFERVLNACIGRRMVWNVIQSTHEGKTSNKVDSYATIEPEVMEIKADEACPL